jgi:hypothetical protein
MYFTYFFKGHTPDPSQFRGRGFFFFVMSYFEVCGCFSANVLSKVPLRMHGTRRINLEKKREYIFFNILHLYTCMGIIF